MTLNTISFAKDKNKEYLIFLGGGLKKKRPENTKHVTSEINSEQNNV